MRGYIKSANWEYVKSLKQIHASFFINPLNLLIHENSNYDLIEIEVEKEDVSNINGDIYYTDNAAFIKVILYGSEEYNKLTSGIVITSNSTYYFKNGKLHNENGPAVITKDGNEYWYINGLFDRKAAPAYITKTEKRWYREDKLEKVENNQNS